MKNHRRKVLMSLLWIAALLASCHMPVRVPVQPTESLTATTIPPTQSVQTSLTSQTPLPPTTTLEPSSTATMQPSSTPTTQPSHTPSSTPSQEALPDATSTLLPTATLDPNAPTLMVTALQNTNCRAGPGLAYEVVAYLLEGARVPAYARDRLDAYWFVQSPRDRAERCWVWSGSTEIEGKPSVLPILETLPALTLTPTP